MKIAVCYATREGQTRRIAEHVAERLRDVDVAADLFDVARLPDDFALEGYDAALLAASVHVGKHEREMIAFARAHHAELHRLPCAFLSVSLSAAGVDDAGRTAEQRHAAARSLAEALDRFFHHADWHPRRVLPVAGALPYTRYNPFIRWLMKQIVKRAGGTTDTHHDHEFTDWGALDRFVDGFVAECDRAAPPAEARLETV